MDEATLGRILSFDNILSKYLMSSNWNSGCDWIKYVITKMSKFVTSSFNIESSLRNELKSGKILEETDKDILAMSIQIT